ncbi:hypothetical protein [Streptomyces sp. NPDC126514]|uniref:hypothetical protein n=1 Tax=Streptomyces sp. NPDC126514 TaxID=3155210 RepID=UPI0033342231
MLVSDVAGADNATVSPLHPRGFVHPLRLRFPHAEIGSPVTGGALKNRPNVLLEP